MEATNVASCGIVQEVLTKDNYDRWKTLMKNYLEGKDLWGVVQSGSVSTDQDRRMNAEALHTIQLSCGPKIFNEITHSVTAKEAWNRLAARYGYDLRATADIEQGVVDYSLLHQYGNLYQFVEKGDWPKAESFIRLNNGAIFFPSNSGRTVLHVATLAGHVHIVDGLVKLGRNRLVEMQDDRRCTALALAAHLTGNTDVAKCMVENKGVWGGVREDLLGIENEDGEIPLLLAAAKGHKQITRYLYHTTPEVMLNKQGSPRNRVMLLERCIKAEIFDVALKLLESYQQLPTESVNYGFGALHALAQMPRAFLSGCQFGLLYHNKFCRAVMNFLLPIKLLRIREIYEQKYCTHNEVLQILKHFQREIERFSNKNLDDASVYDAMLHAAKHGIVEFINAMTEVNPNLLWAMDSRKRSIFSYAVLHRKQKVFQLIYPLNGRKDIIKYRTDVFGNNLLHLAGHLGPSSALNCRPGAALQMQREIQWFKAVEKVVHPRCKEDRNDEDKKPHEVFTEAHEELVKAGTKWAKETAGSFTLVGTLIITVMFAAAFTVPGGNDQNTGEPIFSKRKAFTVFIIADAVSLFASVASVLIFIGILTSRYAEQDFLIRFPLKLLSGLLFLFLSVVSMIVAFCAALDIVLSKYHGAHTRLIIGAIILGSIPVLVLVPSQLRLIYEILRSTLFNPIRHRIEKK